MYPKKSLKNTKSKSPIKKSSKSPSRGTYKKPGTRGIEGNNNTHNRMDFNDDGEYRNNIRTADDYSRPPPDTSYTDRYPNPDGIKNSSKIFSSSDQQKSKSTKKKKLKDNGDIYENQPNYKQSKNSVKKSPSKSKSKIKRKSKSPTTNEILYRDSDADNYHGDRQYNQNTGPNDKFESFMYRDRRYPGQGHYGGLNDLHGYREVHENQNGSFYDIEDAYNKKQYNQSEGMGSDVQTNSAIRYNNQNEMIANQRDGSSFRNNYLQEDNFQKINSSEKERLMRVELDKRNGSNFENINNYRGDVYSIQSGNNKSSNHKMSAQSEIKNPSSNRSIENKGNSSGTKHYKNSEFQGRGSDQYFPGEVEDFQRRINDDDYNESFKHQKNNRSERIINPNLHEWFRKVERKLIQDVENIPMVKNLLLKNREDHAQYFNYDYWSDRNLTHLRYWVHLLWNEIINLNALCSPYGNQLYRDDDLNKERTTPAEQTLQKIVNHLLKEKVTTANIMSKMLLVFENWSIEAADVFSIIKQEIRNDDRWKGLLLNKLANINEDLAYVEKVREYFQNYLTNKDARNIEASIEFNREYNTVEHNSNEMQNLIKSIQKTKIWFDKLRRFEDISEKHNRLLSKMKLRDQKYKKIVQQCERLTDDFMSVLMEYRDTKTIKTENYRNAVSSLNEQGLRPIDLNSNSNSPIRIDKVDRGDNYGNDGNYDAHRYQNTRNDESSIYKQPVFNVDQYNEDQIKKYQDHQMMKENHQGTNQKNTQYHLNEKNHPVVSIHADNSSSEKVKNNNIVDEKPVEVSFGKNFDSSNNISLGHSPDFKSVENVSDPISNKDSNQNSQLNVNVFNRQETSKTSKKDGPSMEILTGKIELVNDFKINNGLEVEKNSIENTDPQIVIESKNHSNSDDKLKDIEIMKNDGVIQTASDVEKSIIIPSVNPQNLESENTIDNLIKNEIDIIPFDESNKLDKNANNKGSSIIKVIEPEISSSKEKEKPEGHDQNKFKSALQQNPFLLKNKESLGKKVEEPIKKDLTTIEKKQSEKKENPSSTKIEDKKIVNEIQNEPKNATNLFKNNPFLKNNTQQNGNKSENDSLKNIIPKKDIQTSNPPIKKENPPSPTLSAKKEVPAPPSPFTKKETPPPPPPFTKKEMTPPPPANKDTPPPPLPPAKRETPSPPPPPAKKDTPPPPPPPAKKDTPPPPPPPAKKETPPPPPPLAKKETPPPPPPPAKKDTPPPPPPPEKKETPPPPPPPAKKETTPPPPPLAKKETPPPPPPPPAKKETPPPPPPPAKKNTISGDKTSPQNQKRKILNADELSEGSEDGENKKIAEIKNAEPVAFSQVFGGDDDDYL